MVEMTSGDLARRIEVLPRKARIQAIRKLVEHAIRCGAYTDVRASERLRATGSYSSFDEPGAAQSSRDLLQELVRIGG